MIIHLPFPNPALNPNRASGNHWAATRKLRLQTKQDGFYAAKEAMQTQKLPAQKQYQMEITYVTADKRRIDRDNLLASSKNTIDGIAMALGIDDNDLDPIIIRRAFGKPEMIVEITGD